MPFSQTGSAELVARRQAIAHAYRADEGETVAAVVRDRPNGATSSFERRS